MLTIGAGSIWRCTVSRLQHRESLNQIPSNLDHVQSVLEEITLESFDLIGSHASKMRALSAQPGWNLFDTREYAEQSLLFIRNVDGLSKAGNLPSPASSKLAESRGWVVVGTHRLGAAQ